MLFEMLAGYTRKPVVLGHSGAEVFQLVSPGKPTLFVKQGATVHSNHLRAEAARLKWLQGKSLVPELIYLHEDAHGTALVMTSVPGVNLTHFNDSSPEVKRRMTVTLARALKQFHAADARGCPFDHRAVKELRRLEMQLSEREASAGDSSKLQAARAKLEALYQMRPEEDLVLTHGDACLPNVLVLEGELTGFVDLGAAGLGDRTRDLERACWSLGYNYGEGYDDVFLEAYGVAELDRKKLDFYRTLESFSFEEDRPFV